MVYDFKKDLPLVANANDILVDHYIFNLKCDFEEKIFSGYVILQLKSLYCSKHSDKISENGNLCVDAKSSSDIKTFSKSNAIPENNFHSNIDPEHAIKCDQEMCATNFQNEFLLILDCNDINVQKVEELRVEDHILEKFTARKKPFLIKDELHFAVGEWSLKIWKKNINCACNFPELIKISYRTMPEGVSLLWVYDQDTRPAVYTYGSWINNRSLFPCQEPPHAMATWEAKIHVPESAVVLMSGDNEPEILCDSGFSTYFYYTKMTLPLSTLALAVGFWKAQKLFNRLPLAVNVNCRILASPSILEKAVQEFADYVLKCLQVTESYFGPYPFSRIDLLIVPRGFGSLGMASPNVIFLSQSLLAGDGSMCYRIAHEIAHTWFGLLIGAYDWTEEWLSEGFATYMEDIFHSKVMDFTKSEEEEFFEVKAFLRLKTLKAEYENNEPELLVLRPNKGEILTEEIEGTDAVILKNGRNPEKGFIQVHYIKGYFLLKFLSEIVGFANFMQFLRLYIKKYKHQLVQSKEILEFYAATFPEIGDQGFIDEIVCEWLHNSSLPKELESMSPSSTNTIYATALLEANKWKAINRAHVKKRSTKRRKYNFDGFQQLSSDQLVIVMEILLEEEKMAPLILKHIALIYSIEQVNAEIRHRWCELVVKHNYRAGYDCLRQFLMDDLAMGVYLYGELILTGKASHKALAEECFCQVRSEMEPNYVVTIEEMLGLASS